MNNSKTVEWLNNKIVPAANKFAAFKVIRAINGGFRFAMPVILTGAVFQILGNIGKLVSASTTYSTLVSSLNNLTFGLLGLVFAYGIAYSSAQAHKINANPVALIAMSLYLVMLKPGFADGGFQITFSYLGATGSAVAMLAGVLTGEVCALFVRKGWIIKGKGLPDFIVQWFEPIIPGVLLLLAAGTLTYILNVDFIATLSKIFQPIVTGADTLLGLIAINLANMVGWFFGIHTMATSGFLNPVLLSNIAENNELFLSGLAPTIANGFHITTLQTKFAWMTIGGAGSFFMLNILFLTSKVKSVKALGRASIVPSLFCISEPILFGAPVVLNPVLGIPMIINQAFVNPILTYIAFATNLVKVPFNTTFLPFLPNPIQAFLYNNDWKGVFLVFVIMAVNLVVWYPFFKAYERQMTTKEESKA